MTILYFIVSQLSKFRLLDVKWVLLKVTLEHLVNPPVTSVKSFERIMSDRLKGYSLHPKPIVLII